MNDIEKLEFVINELKNNFKELKNIEKWSSTGEDYFIKQERQLEKENALLCNYIYSHYKNENIAEGIILSIFQSATGEV